MRTKFINWKRFGLTTAGVLVIYGIAAWMLKPDTVDFVNVALLPDLAEEVGADLTTRLQLADVGQNALRLAHGFETAQEAGADVDSEVRAGLEALGQEVFDLLTVEQRKAFYYLFRSRTVLPVSYRTEASDIPGVPRFVFTFGWKRSADRSNLSIADTAAELDRAWELIPSETIAEALLKHPGAAVKNAAERWLQERTQRHAKPQKRSFDERADEMRARHQQRTQQMRRDFDRRVAQNKAAHEQRRSATRTESDSQNADRRAAFEQRAAELRADHERRRAEMRAEHDRRSAEMRAEHTRRMQQKGSPE